MQMRARLAWVLFALGSLLLTCGLVAGVANHEVMDGERFARTSTTSARIRPWRSSSAFACPADPRGRSGPGGGQATRRERVDLAGEQLGVRSDRAARGRRAARRLHETEPRILRLADIGAVLSAVLQQLDPDAAAHLPPGLDVTLSTIGSQGFAARSLHVTHVVNVLAWLLPLLAVLCMIGGLLLSANRREAAPRIGWAVAASGGLLVVVGLAISVWTSFLDTDNLSGALTVAVWDELLTPYWWTAGATLWPEDFWPERSERAPLDPHRPGRPPGPRPRPRT